MPATLTHSSHRTSTNRAGHGDPILAFDSFVNSSPLGYKAGDSNLYRYVGNGPTIATDPEGLQKYVANSHDFWTGTIVAGQAAGVPTGIFAWNRANGTIVMHDPNVAGARTTKGVFGGKATVNLTDTEVKRYERIGNAGQVQMPVDSDPNALGIVLNEAIAALNLTANPKWLVQIINNETQYNDERRAKAEEAMSEMIAFIYQKNANKPVPTYQDIIDLKCGDDWYWAITPGHRDLGEKWHGNPEAKWPMSETLFYATIWMLHQPGAVPQNIPADLKQFYMATYGPAAPANKLPPPATIQTQSVSQPTSTP